MSCRQLIRVAGLRASGAGYQNAEQSIRILRSTGHYEILDLGWTLPAELHLWKLQQMRGLRKWWHLARIVALNAASAIRVIADWKHRRGVVYVPYPAVFLLWLMSWLPCSVRPKLIADAYISIWDAQFKDRGKARGTVAERLIKAFESRALNVAEVVVTDTEANRTLMIDELGLEADRVRAWPLAIDDSAFLAASSKEATRHATTVVFVGTLIPLHGVENILAAVKLMAPAGGVKFRLIGDGQLGPAVAQFIAQNPDLPLTWLRNWHSLDQLADEIARADICLGVFGGAGKAARVLPFKLYMYLASGKAIVTQAMLSTPDHVPRPPAAYVEASTGEDIARAIRELIMDPVRVADLERQARGYYDEFLAGGRLLKRWDQLLEDLV